jgi:probable F420-dependent oxidoreductase
MKIDSHLQDLAGAAARARALESEGYDAAWTIEMNSDPFLPLAVAAEATWHIALGTSIAVAFARSPMAVAYTANDLQRHTGGRFMLGLGSQVKAHVTRRFSMPWGQPAAQMREFILALRSIWSSCQDGTRLDFQGEYYRHTLMTPQFTPPPHEFGPPGVLLAGVGELMTRTAGEVADGLICHGFTSARWLRERTLPALSTGREQAGRAMDGFDVTCAPFIATGTDAEIEAAIAVLRRRIAFYASTPAYRGVLEVHGWGALGEELTTLSMAGRWEDMAGLITDEILDAYAIVATPDELPAQVAKRFGGLLTRLSFDPPPSLGRDAAADLVGRLRACC